jgi:hypothetical protein
LISKDKAFLQASIPDFEAYILSDELLWPVTARGQELPRLTIGSALLARARLEAAGERIESLATDLDIIRSKWRVAWEHKAGREFRMRIGLWQNYLDDYHRDPYQYAGTYRHDIRTRVMIHFLLEELPHYPPEEELLENLDVMLKKYFVPGDFIWDVELQNGFPINVFWFLYGTLKN